MNIVDEQVEKLHTKKAKDGTVSTTGTITYPQVALIALNPHTGQVLALVGGRNYGVSQLNHAVCEAAYGIDLQALCVRGGVQLELVGSATARSGGCVFAGHHVERPAGDLQCRALIRSTRRAISTTITIR